MLSKLRQRYLNFWTAVTVILLAFFVIALVIPLSSLCLNSFRNADGGLTLAN